MPARMVHSIRGLLFLLTVAASIQVAIAQKGTHITRRVSFQTGSSSTVIRGKARWGASYIYLLRARAGQTLTVRLEGVPVMRIIPPGAKNYEALEGADIVREWTGKLPANGDYQIDVGHTNDKYGIAPYKLEIKVE